MQSFNFLYCVSALLLSINIEIYLFSFLSYCFFSERTTSLGILCRDCILLSQKEFISSLMSILIRSVMHKLRMMIDSTMNVWSWSSLNEIDIVVACTGKQVIFFNFYVIISLIHWKNCIEFVVKVFTILLRYFWEWLFTWELFLSGSRLRFSNSQTIVEAKHRTVRRPNIGLLT